ncbi:hypothetical protein [Pantoea rodasii]|uniref:hypothetical protein n=1 Tax=Pantoea rodasii TaxID=1076549 RepID=UPI001FCCC93A|nr:hypothetical protein [Pantoea rodasii]
MYNTLDQEAKWLKAHPNDAAKILSPLWGNLPLSTVEQANQQRSYQIEPVKKSDLAEQQKIADAFYQAKLLPKAIDAQDVGTWQPGVRQ